MGWGIKSVAEYAVANHHRVAKLLEAVKIERDDDKNIALVSDPGAFQAAIDFLKGSPYRERDRKGNLGTEVHATMEAYVKKQPWPTVSEDAAPYVEQFKKFLDEWAPEFEVAEASVYNRTLKYAGTLDAIAKINYSLPGIGASTVLLDYKTTGSGVYPEAAQQLAAYRFAEFIGMPDGKEAPMPPVDGTAVVWLRPDGYDVVPVVADEKVFRAFRHTIEQFRWMEELSKDVIGIPLPTPKKEEATA